MSNKVSGKVSGWNNQKGYGFITGDDGKEYFVHNTKIKEGRTYIKLARGDKVEFISEPGEKGDVATEVVITERFRRPINER